MTAEQIYWERIRRMTPAEKLANAMRLYWSARTLKAAAIRAQRPDITPAEVERLVREAFLYARE